MDKTTTIKNPPRFPILSYLVEDRELNDILLEIMRGRNYNRIIAQDLKKDVGNNLRQIQELTKLGFVIPTKEKRLNKTVYHIKEGYDTFIKLAKINLEMGTHKEFMLTEYFRDTFPKYSSQIIKEGFKYIRKLDKTNIDQRELNLIIQILFFSPTAFRLVFNLYKDKHMAGIWWGSSTLTVHELKPEFPFLAGDRETKLIRQSFIAEQLKSILNKTAKKEKPYEELKREIMVWIDWLEHPKKTKFDFGLVSDITEILMCALVTDYLLYPETRYLVDTIFNRERIIQARKKGDLKEFFEEMDKLYGDVDRLSMMLLQHTPATEKDKQFLQRYLRKK